MEALMNASKAGNIDGLYAAIRENPHILCLIDEISFGETPLHAAAVSGHVQFAMEIMRLKPSFARKPNLDGFTPVHVALQKKHTQMALWLIEKDSELVRVKGREGITPLHYVVEQGNDDLVKTFLSVCPKAIEDVTVRNQTALHIALINNHLESFQLLINQLRKENDEEDNDWKKMVLNCKDLEGKTVLHIATIRNQLQATGIIQDLLGEVIVSISDPIVPSPQQTQNQDIITPAPVTNNLSQESKLFWKDYFKFEFGKHKPDRARSDLLVVAILLATSTYQAVLSPPGGLEGGYARVASIDPSCYIMFIICNSIGFSASQEIIQVLLYEHPLYWEIKTAKLGMIFTYLNAIVAISPPGYMARICSAGALLMLGSVRLIPYCMRKYCNCWLISTAKSWGLTVNSSINLMFAWAFND